MEFHPKDLPISKVYDLKNENDAMKAVEDMVNLGFRDKKEGFKVLMPKETKLAKRIGIYNYNRSNKRTSTKK